MQSEPSLSALSKRRPNAARATNPGEGDALVDRVVGQLNEICKVATLEFSISVGRLIIDSFYRGDCERWRKRGTKQASFRKLSRHPELPMSAVALYRSVAIYELSQRLGMSDWKHVCATHLRLVLPLPEEEQEKLLKLAETNTWSIRRLDEEVSLVRKERPRDRRGGRKRASPAKRIIRSLERDLDELQNFVGVDGQGKPTPEDLDFVLQSIQRVTHLFAALEKEMSGRLVGGVQRSPAAGK
jgi:hypothetical protein